MHLISILTILIIISSILIPFIRKIYFVYSVSVANFIIFFITLFSSPGHAAAGSIVFKELAFDPLYLKNFPMIYTLLTSMFIHYDIMHLLGNMIALLFIGIPFEHRVGQGKMAFIYLGGGIFATLFFSIANFHDMALIGASGAIFAVLGGFAASFPNDLILVPIPLPIILFVRMRVITAAIIFGLLQIFFSFISPYYGSNIAYLAHLGGLIGGIAIAKIIVRKKGREKIDFDYSAIKNLLKNERQMEIYKRIEEAEEPEIKEAWLSYLIKDLRCPHCGGRLEVRNGRPYCRKCGYIR